MALILSAIRWVQMIFFWPDGQKELVWKTIWMGFRFDLLIVGYWLAPLVICLLLKKLITGRGLDSPRLAQFYLGGSWLLITLLYFRDLIFFYSRREHMWLEDHLSALFLSSELLSAPSWWAWIGIGLLTWGLFQSGAIRFERWLLRLKEYSRLSVLIILLWTAFLCRGSLGDDHIRRNDCDYALNKTVKSFCMNPVFMFTKNR